MTINVPRPSPPPPPRSVTLPMRVVIVAVVVAVVVIVAVIFQARSANQENTRLLSLLLSTSGCTVEDTPKSCDERRAEISKREGEDRIAQVDCRTRRAVQGRPALPANERCTE